MTESPKYRIAWRHKETGKTGTGTKEFTREEAAALVDELNRDYPHIEHQAKEVE